MAWAGLAACFSIEHQWVRDDRRDHRDREERGAGHDGQPGHPQGAHRWALSGAHHDHGPVAACRWVLRREPGVQLGALFLPVGLKSIGVAEDAPAVQTRPSVNKTRSAVRSRPPYPGGGSNPAIVLAGILRAVTNPPIHKMPEKDHHRSSEQPEGKREAGSDDERSPRSCVTGEELGARPETDHSSHHQDQRGGQCPESTAIDDPLSGAAHGNRSGTKNRRRVPRRCRVLARPSRQRSVGVASV